MVLLLTLGFGLVSIDRFMIMPLFPVIMQDLNLDFQDLGLVTGVLAITWGISSIFMANLADRIGLRAVIIPAVILFSLMAGISGLATGLISLMMIRACISLVEDAWASATVAIRDHRPSRTIPASPPGTTGW
ncbi:MFS transporter [Halomonas sp. G15]|uniref:MFS transporter n=1 Tax=Halomonas sp. G15 TaxID=2903521 RepID=UPI001E2D8906|nr:MFS transporter [Halomonas sp. G15]MCE0733175.1 MFS transporter [Halomonas sp. G15]